MTHLHRRSYEESFQHLPRPRATEPNSDVNHPPSPAVNDLKKAFKRLGRMYMRLQRPPLAKDMETIWKFKKRINFEDFVLWKEQVGIKKESYV
jgi:hypothetical protein